MTDFLRVTAVQYNSSTSGLTKPFTGILSLIIKINKNALFRPLTAKTGVRFPVGSPKSKVHFVCALLFLLSEHAGNRPVGNQARARPADEGASAQSCVAVDR